MTAGLQGVIPNFPVRNVDAGLAYQSNEPAARSYCRISVDEVDELGATLNARGARILEDPEDNPWVIGCSPLKTSAVMSSTSFGSATARNNPRHFG
jgi:hypothetical protein